MGGKNKQKPPSYPVADVRTHTALVPSEIQDIQGINTFWKQSGSSPTQCCHSYNGKHGGSPFNVFILFCINTKVNFKN